MDGRKIGLAVIGFLVIIVLLLFVATKFFVINDPQPEDSEVRTIVITSITEGPDYDIFFTDKEGGRYYINRGTERGLELNSLKKIAMGKAATIHLPKFAIGVSNHIAQMKIKDSIIYTEFD